MDSEQHEHLFSPDWIPILLSQAVALGTGLAGIHLSSRFVSPETYGHYSLFLTLVPVAALITHAGLIRHAARHWAQEPDRRAYLHWLLQASVRPSALVLGAAILGIVLALLQGRSAWAAGFGLAALATLAGALSQVAQNCLQTARLYWTDFLVTATGSTTRTFLPIIAVVWCSESFLVMSGAFLVHASITAALGYALWRRHSLGTGHTIIHHGSADYLRNFAITGLLNLFNAGVVRWVIGAYYSADAVGYVSLAGNIGFAITGILSNACAQFFFPRLLVDSGPRIHTTRRTFVLYGFAAVSIGGILHIMLPWLVGTLLAPTYAPALPFVLPMYALGTSIGALALVQNHYLAEKQVSSATMFSSLFSITLALGLIIAARHSLTTASRFLFVTPLLLGIAALVTPRLKHSKPV